MIVRIVLAEFINSVNSINKNLFLIVFVSATVPDNSVKWLFREQSPLMLRNWSQLDTLLSHFSGNAGKDNLQKRLQVYIAGLQDLCSCELEEMSDEEENKGSVSKDKLLFLVEQLKLLSSPVKRYSCETLLWAFHIFASSPTTYSLMRNTGLTLPHASYLKRLVSVFNMGSGLKEASVHEEYLKQKCQNLDERERNVMLLLDEIHVATQVSYKEGKLEGSASNSTSTSEANTAQVFMISSLLSKSKDVVGIVPVKNLNAEMLHEMIRKVLQLLHSIGYLVTCVISDNNRVNRNAFTKLCGGKLQIFIQNPFNPMERLFFLFDTVHLFKCIRNNWLAQNDAEKTFLFPSIETPICSNDVISRASFSHLRKLFCEEKSSPVKLAPALNQKCLYPTSTEKQNVSLMLKIFDQRNALALEHFEKIWQVDTKGTREFILTIEKLWNIVNVKHPHKHLRLRNEDCKGVTSTCDNNVQFIQRVIQWLHEWNKLKLKPREGTLSTETMTALEHTLRGLLELASYLLAHKQFDYVLLGKFQTDNLEFRFSQYRQMSGCNFHVSVQQLLEGEKKLKLLSVLKLVSASKGTLTLKDITEPLEERKSQLTAASDEDYKTFLPVLADCDSVELNAEQLKALVFVTGYAVSKVLPHTDCDVCKNELRMEKKLQVEGTSDCYTYLSALDRGGLTWPTNLAVDIIAQVFTVFQALVGKDTCERQFLSSTSQRNIVLKLSTKRISDLGLCVERCEGCGVDFADMVAKCCKPAVNIFLNNYSKSFCDKSSGSSGRKLKTFTK